MKEEIKPPPRINKIGQRIPYEYFVTKGKGESDIIVHSGSYHDALRDAKIEDFNVMYYSSIIPDGSVRVEQPKEYVRGSVLETIMANVTTEQGVPAMAGIIFAQLVDSKTHEIKGGIVAERTKVGSDDKEEMREILYKSIQELYFFGYNDKYDLGYTETIIESVCPKKKFGTAIAVIGFCSYRENLL